MAKLYFKYLSRKWAGSFLATFRQWSVGKREEFKDRPGERL